MSTKLNWGILGTGAIAKAFARGLQMSEHGQLVAVGSRSAESAAAFGAEFGVERNHASYEALLADDQVQAVYIATPHPYHAEWAINTAEAGKHILCEKPLAVNHAQAMAIFDAAHRNNVFAMEGFMYRCHPQTAKLVELIRSGAIGQVRVIQATFSFHAGFNPEGRLFKNDLAGGGILDVGCYTASISRLIAGTAVGKPFADPIEFTAVGHLGETGVDEWAIASAKFPSDILVQLSTGVGVRQDSSVRVYGTDGWIHLPNPYAHGRDGGGSFEIFLHQKGQTETITIETSVTSFALEADVVAKAVAQGQTQAPSPAMSWDDSLGNMATLDRWRDAIGLVYDMEKTPAPVYNRPPRARADHRMPTSRIAHLDKDISRLFMGVDNQRDIRHGSVMFDDFIERGGNAFDTAYVYAGGACEKTLGQWVKNRGIREQVVILGKGAHTPFCDPENLTRQLHESLDRLQMEYLDIYMMHRDNPDIPVGEFVDVLNEHIAAGRIRAIGGSNWTTDRIDAFTEYAKANGKQAFSAVSNNLSLARMVDPVWAGCLAASEPAMHQWFVDRQMPLMPWSSQARGFFTDRAAPDKTDDPQLVRCWYSDDNFERRRRAIELAEKKGCTPIQIALAYVLNQPFPTFPLIGPRTLEETRTSLPALDVEISADEVKWLDLRD